MAIFFIADVLLWHTILEVALSALLLASALVAAVWRYRRGDGLLGGLAIGAPLALAWVLWEEIAALLMWPALYLTTHFPLIT